jgi:DNA-binding NtrC family response regulator
MESQRTYTDLTTIESLIRDGNSSQALSVLRQMRPSLNLQPDLPDKAQFYLLWAESLFLLGRYTESFRKAGVTLRLVAKSSEHSMYAKARYLTGMICIRLGRLQDAVEDLNESYACYKRIGDHAGMLLPLNNLAQAHFMAGDFRRSREVLESCISFHRGNDPIATASLRINLARVLARLGEFRQSQKELESQCVTNCAVEAKRRVAVSIKGVISVHKLETEPASRLLTSCQQFFAECSRVRDMNVCQEYLGLLEYNRGNYKKAREYYQHVLDTPEPTASAVAQTLRMLTDVEIAEGNWDAAMETAKKAEVAITKINERIELGALWRAYGQICTHRGEHDTARDFFTKSIDLLHEIGARYELALSYLVCGQSESYSREERKFNLDTARMMFVDMEVPKRVEQVEQFFLKLTDSQAHAPFVGKRPAGHGCPAIITKNPGMLQIVSTIDRIKDTNMTILITGETGTGKDLLAEYIHKTSVRSGGPFRVVNSAAIPETLLESELFGFRKGTYTGATQDKKGIIESANGGTFYFDEIGEALPSVQAKILRVIETRRLRRLGDTSDVAVDVRFIAATNYNLAARVEEGLFRKDLYYRLRQMPISLPALREKKGDIELLVRHFLSEAGVADPGHDNPELLVLVQSFRSQEWPGNVRELKFVVNRLVALATKNDIGEILKLYDREKSSIQMGSDDLNQRERLLMALRKNGDNRSKAARELGVPESTLRYKLKKFCPTL